MSDRFDTRAVHAGREDLTDLGVHAVPLDFSTTYPSRDSREEAQRLDLLAGWGPRRRATRLRSREQPDGRAFRAGSGRPRGM